MKDIPLDQRMSHHGISFSPAVGERIVYLLNCKRWALSDTSNINSLELPSGYTKLIEKRVKKLEQKSTYVVVPDMYFSKNPRTVDERIRTFGKLFPWITFDKDVLLREFDYRFLNKKGSLVDSNNFAGPMAIKKYENFQLIALCTQPRHAAIQITRPEFGSERRSYFVQITYDYLSYCLANNIEDSLTEAQKIMLKKNARGNE